MGWNHQPEYLNIADAKYKSDIDLLLRDLDTAVDFDELSEDAKARSNSGSKITKIMADWGEEA